MHDRDGSRIARGGRIVALACGACAVAWGGCPESDPAPPEAPVAVRADGFVSSRVAASLGQLSRAATTRGFTLEGVERRGFLVERGPEVAEISLRSGNCYLVIATASEAVRELEITLYDGEGTEVARDDATGPLAALHHCPPQSGTFFASVQATAGNGLYGLRTFRGPSGLAVRTEDIVRAAEPERPAR